MRELDSTGPVSYADIVKVKTTPKPKRLATPREVAELARRVKWQDVTLPFGDSVAAETIRQIFQDAERGLKRGRTRRRAHAIAA